MRWILIAPLLLLLVLFALSNRQPVDLRLWPFDFIWSVPVAVAVLIFSALFFLLGALIAWLSSLPYRRRARQMQDAARLLEAELADYRAREQQQVAARLAGPQPVEPVARS